MTERADSIRQRRRAFAAPGSPLDRAVRLLAILLPAIVGAVAAAMLIAPLSPRGEISFLLDRNKVAIANDRLRVNDAMYRGQDERGRPFSVAAGEAVQASASEPIVRMKELTAQLQLSDGPAVLSAPAGRYLIDDEQMEVTDTVRFSTANGYSMVARNVAVDLAAQTLMGEGRVEGKVPAGTFSADRILADLDARTVALDGNARLRMVPGQLKLP